MRVIGASWGRTGTTSAAAALELLGLGPCFQMQDVWPHPKLARLWNEHRAGRHVDWVRGKGPQARGTGEAVLMALAGRRGVASELAGPGASLLQDRLG